MQTSTSTQYSFCHLLIEYLHCLGIKYFVLSPGARNSLLLHAVVKKKLPHSCHFDERGAAFFALGYNKAQINQDNWQNLACVVTTSGSAIANTYPAVIEAYESETPLLILTADRPKKLHGIRSNQTTDQNNFFAKHCLYSATLDFGKPKISNAEVLETVRKVFQHSNGPSHINIALSEPFVFDKKWKKLPTSEKGIIKKHISAPKSNQKNIQSTLAILKKIFSEIHEKNEDCLFIVGECSSNESKTILETLKNCPYPVFLDITVSNYFLVGKEKNSHFPFLFHHQTFADAIDGSVHTIIHFGGAFVSKSLSIYLKKNPPKNYIHIENLRRTKKYDPNNVVTRHFACDYHLLMPHVRTIVGKKNRQKMSTLPKIAQKIKMTAEQDYFQTSNKNDKTSKLTERIFVFSLLEKSLQSSKTNIFFGNSMPIRMGDIYPKPHGFHNVFYNRGVSGIDGLIATICGIAEQNRSNKLIGVIGDLSALHDLNSFFLLTNLEKKNRREKSIKPSVSLIIINNEEGSIFRHLEWFKKFQNVDQAQTILARHSLDFLNIAKMASLPYRHLKKISNLDDCLNWVFQSGTKILEVKINTKESVDDYKNYCRKSKNIFLETYFEKKPPQK